MPYVLAPMIHKEMPGLWLEGTPYKTEVIYDICSGDISKPPVHYESHLIKPHSICHFDAPKHIIKDGKTIDEIFRDSLNTFYGPVTILKLKNPKFNPHPILSNVLHWKVSLEELKLALFALTKDIPEKLFISFEDAESDFYSNHNKAMTLSSEAAEWLVSNSKFNLFGTIWKSTDFEPNSRERPIHRKIFSQAGIIECLDLTRVPEGVYFLSAFPLPLVGATESPVCPVLFSKDEIRLA